MSFEHRRDTLLSLEILPPELRSEAVINLLLLSLDEDLSGAYEPQALNENLALGDITSRATLKEDSQLSGKLTAKAVGVIAGLPLFAAVCYLVDENIHFDPQIKDGAQVKPGNILAYINGPGRALLTAERTALNFLGRMSGVATLTQQYVAQLADTNATLLDTRKTLPGFRKLDKYAVRMGGGQNHRAGLYDMVMVKDNHIDGAGSIEAAVAGVRHEFGNQYPIEVEVKDLKELEIALSLNIERIMLDNMSPNMMREAVAITAKRTELEASGNVTLQTIKEIAETGVDFISVGALTHSVPVLDISMRLIEAKS